MDSTIDSVTTNQSQHKRGLRIMSVNCRSLISSTKHLDLQNLIETHNPDIILGCESHLDPQIASSEVFPINYSNPYRKDRKLGEGGVFIAAKSDLITTEINIKTDCEIVWATLTVQGSFPIYIGSYYRRPSSKTDMIEELEKSIEQITSKVKNNMPHIILGGDFNLPDINWDNTTVNTNPQYGQEINSKLVEIVTENDFIQMVKEPTRGKNILDLILTNNPGLIERTQTQPGMSDHEIVITDINIKAKTQKKKPRNKHNDKYIRGILNEDSTNEEQKSLPWERNSWQYIKSRKKTHCQHINPRRTVPRTEVIDSKGKAAILNEQKDSVFTDEDKEYIAISFWETATSKT
ncbi:unnamed protein product [Mytilus edulis]|uniref:Endonuclease/exonuclease/phosphatase domain-containing protein n=1 Tax=Mytilus edulis TaxID=6550 RepID=A0A8S3RU50_MYTED|nr:unnamed protein product [Mytilus edulis]